VAALKLVGVPVMTPVAVFKLKPAGNAPEILNVTPSPSNVGTIGVIAVFTFRITGLGYRKLEGGLIMTDMFMVTELLPAELEPVIVYDLKLLIAVGLPEMIPVEGFNTSPAGNGEDTE
jgi:hypothetical protein